MDEVLLIKLRESGAVNKYISHIEGVKIGNKVIVEAERGIDYGVVINKLAPGNINPKLKLTKKAIRKASPEDLARIENNKNKSRRAFRICERKIKEYKLDMKLIQAEYSFDGSKILFYFVSEKRVDFRELVKELAKIFKVRIEMRQVGVRDETRIFGGIGLCGRELCCASFLKRFNAVSIKMAKEQKLMPLPAKISGICGRLLCCLSYEYKTYQAINRTLPKEGQVINTSKGKAKVIEVNTLKQEVKAETDDKKIIKLNYQNGVIQR